MMGHNQVSPLNAIPNEIGTKFSVLVPEVYSAAFISNWMLFPACSFVFKKTMLFITIFSGDLLCVFQATLNFKKLLKSKYKKGCIAMPNHLKVIKSLYKYK
jgi:hypothetical protein